MKKEIKIVVNVNQVSPEKLEVLIKKLSEVATVENGIVFYDDENEEQLNGIREVLDNNLLGQVI